jgi:hypothetical protein
MIIRVCVSEHMILLQRQRGMQAPTAADVKSLNIILNWTINRRKIEITDTNKQDYAGYIPTTTEHMVSEFQWYFYNHIPECTLCVFKLRHCNIWRSALFTVYELNKQKCVSLDMRMKCHMRKVLLQNAWNCGASCNVALQCVILSSSKAYSTYLVARDVDDNQSRITSTSQGSKLFQ